MTTDVRPTFLGIEIHGDINHSRGQKDQRTMEEFAPIIQAVLEDPSVAEFGWHQYTPYYNDGDPCVFSANSAWVKLVEGAAIAEPADEDDDEDEEGRIEIEYDYSNRLGDRPRTWNHETKSYDYADYTGPDEARYDRLLALADAIDDGEFDNVLLKTFGDHCEVTVRRDGIQVDEYSHD